MHTYNNENRAFIEMYKAAVIRLQSRTPEDIARKTGFYYDNGKNTFIVNALNKEVTVSYPDYCFIGDIDDWYKLIILHYMDMADERPAGEGIITFGELTDGLVRGNGFTRKCENEIQSFWGNQSLESLYKMCIKMGGELIESNADFCAKFNILPKYLLTLKIWLKDEELSGSGRIFLNENADFFLTVEDAVTAGEILLEAMKENI